MYRNMLKEIEFTYTTNLVRSDFKRELDILLKNNNDDSLKDFLSWNDKNGTFKDSEVIAEYGDEYILSRDECITIIIDNIDSSNDNRWDRESY